MDINQLEQLSWQKLKAIAEEAGYQKPEDKKWEECIEDIAALFAESSESLESGLVQPKGKYCTKYFKVNKIPYCSTCGAQHINSLQGGPICAESRKDCPRLIELGGKK